MKFTGIVMNPPFNSGLHLKILEKTMESVDWDGDGKLVCIHPAKWLQFPTRERPTFMNGHIHEFTIVDRSKRFLYASSPYLAINSSLVIFKI